MQLHARALITSILGMILISGAMVVTSLGQDKAQNDVGSGDDDWWTSYPDQSSAAGSEVNHPDWVLDALEDKPVLIYVHKGCSYCKPQTEAVNEIVDEYGGDIEFYDISADGSDTKTEEAIAAYDPNGGESYVPLTVILTLVPGEDGEAQVAWHSTEEVTGKDWVQQYVEDAIYYHDQNSDSWNP